MISKMSIYLLLPVFCVLQHLNEQLSSEFERGECSDTLSQVVVRVLLPGLGMLSPDDSEDESVLEEIRQRWCGFLNLDLPGQ